MNQLPTSSRALELARQVLHIEANAVAKLADRVNDDFLSALSMILSCRGRVIVSGMGKSGHIARKIAATFASTGTPAYFVHPAEASHGDLGMITNGDVLLALSNSGESAELVAIVPIIKRLGGKIIAMTGNCNSSLAREANIHLDVAVTQEACPHNLAPTASTTAALAMGDALAVALLDARGFGPDDFARSHPGGFLGLRLLTRVRDIMRTPAPKVFEDEGLNEAIQQISLGGMGMTIIVSQDNKVLGIITDGDLRRAIGNGTDLRNLKAKTVMTSNPHTIRPETMAVEAISLMENFKINALPVADSEGYLQGALNMHDLFRAKIV